MKKNVIRLLAIGLVMCLLLAGCATGQVAASSSAQPSASASSSASAAPATKAPTKGGTMVFGLSTEPKTMEPYLDNGWAQKQIVQCVYRSLFDIAEDGSVIPGLCDKYSVSTDGLTWKFHLIDATFQNGDPVTATDVKFSIEYVRDNDKLAGFFNKIYKQVKAINVIDDKNLEVVTDKPYAPLRDCLASYYSGILSKKWTESHDIKTEPMGCGAFKFVSWERSSNIKVERFDKYAGDVAYLDGIEFDFYADQNARVNALKTGVVDLIDYVPAEQFASIESTKGLTVERVEGPYMFFTLNCKEKPLDNAAVRKAMGYAVNRDDIIKTAFNGEGTPMYGTAFTKTMVGYDQKYDKYYTFDTAKAKEMLATAGFANGFDLLIGCSSQYAFNEKTAVAVQGALKAAGVNVTLDASDWTTFFTKLLAKGFQSGVNGTAAGYNDPDYLTTVYVTNSSYNLANYSSAKMDELMAKASAEVDKTKRAQIYGEAQQLMLDDAPWINLMWRIQAYAKNDTIKGFINLPNGAFVNSASRFNKIYIEK